MSGAASTRVDGAGVVNAEESVRIAQQRRWRDAPATRRGRDVGTFRSDDVAANRHSTFRYHVTVPLFLFGAQVKVALACGRQGVLAGTPADSLRAAC